MMLILMTAMMLSGPLVPHLSDPPTQLDHRFRPAADQNGILTLPASKASCLGDRLHYDSELDAIVEWVTVDERLRWEFTLNDPGRYLILIEYSAPINRGGSRFQVVHDEVRKEGQVHSTGRASRYFPQPLKGPLDLDDGFNQLELHPITAPHGFVMNLKRIRLIPAND